MKQIKEQKEEDKKETDPPQLKTLFFCGKNFLSFTKNKKVTKNFFNSKIDKNTLINVTFIVKPIKEEELKSKTSHLISNIDIDATGISSFNEEEVLFLPMTFFEIIDITETTKRKLPCAEITMKYLVDIENSLNEYLKKLKAIEMQREKEKEKQKEIGMEPPQEEPSPTSVFFKEALNNNVANEFKNLCDGTEEIKQIKSNGLMLIKYKMEDKEEQFFEAPEETTIKGKGKDDKKKGKIEEEEKAEQSDEEYVVPINALNKQHDPTQAILEQHKNNSVIDKDNLKKIMNIVDESENKPQFPPQLQPYLHNLSKEEIYSNGQFKMEGVAKLMKGIKNRSDSLFKQGSNKLDEERKAKSKSQNMNEYFALVAKTIEEKNDYNAHALHEILSYFKDENITEKSLKNFINSNQQEFEKASLKNEEPLDEKDKELMQKSRNELINELSKMNNKLEEIIEKAKKDIGLIGRDEKVTKLYAQDEEDKIYNRNNEEYLTKLKEALYRKNLLDDPEIKKQLNRRKNILKVVPFDAKDNELMQKSREEFVDELREMNDKLEIIIEKAKESDFIDKDNATRNLYVQREEDKIYKRNNKEYLKKLKETLYRKNLLDDPEIQNQLNRRENLITNFYWEIEFEGEYEELKKFFDEKKWKYKGKRIAPGKAIMNFSKETKEEVNLFKGFAMFERNLMIKNILPSTEEAYNNSSSN